MIKRNSIKQLCKKITNCIKKGVEKLKQNPKIYNKKNQISKFSTSTNSNNSNNTNSNIKPSEQKSTKYFNNQQNNNTKIYKNQNNHMKYSSLKNPSLPQNELENSLSSSLQKDSNME